MRRSLPVIALTVLVPLALAVPSFAGGASAAPRLAPPAAVRGVALDQAATGLEQTLKAVDPAHFGGLWVGRTGIVHVATTSKTAAITDAVGRFAYRGQLKLSVVRFPLARLQHVVSDTVRSERSLWAHGVYMSMAYADPARNDVDVFLTKVTPRAVGMVDRRYAPIPVVIRQQPLLRTVACTRTDCGSSMRGGLVIKRVTTLSGVTTTVTCTSGVVVGTGKTGTVLLTAGHCFGNGDTPTADGTKIGTVSQRMFSNGGNIDAEVISLTSAWTPSPCIFTSTSCGDDIEQAISVSKGNDVCKSGEVTGWDCGNITATGAMVNYKFSGSTITLSGQVITDICVLPGDSGGPNTDGTVSLEGLTSGSNYTGSETDAKCASKPASSFTPAPRVLSDTSTYLPYN